LHSDVRNTTRGTCRGKTQDRVEGAERLRGDWPQTDGRRFRVLANIGNYSASVRKYPSLLSAPAAAMRATAPLLVRWGATKSYLSQALSGGCGCESFAMLRPSMKTSEEIAGDRTSLMHQSPMRWRRRGSSHDFGSRISRAYEATNAPGECERSKAPEVIVHSVPLVGPARGFAGQRCRAAPPSSWCLGCCEGSDSTFQATSTDFNYSLRHNL
jgi:hypothetical protein